MAIVIGAPKARKNVLVELYGKTYRVHPVKAAIALNFAISLGQIDTHPEKASTAITAYLRGSMSAEDAREVEARLLDPDDDLDFEDIMEMSSKVAAAEGVSEQLPTTPSSDSLTSQSATGQTWTGTPSSQA